MSSHAHDFITIINYNISLIARKSTVSQSKFDFPYKLKSIRLDYIGLDNIYIPETAEMATKKTDI